jgi:hypothetical protein
VWGCVYFISVVDPDPVGDRHHSGGSGSRSAARRHADLDPYSFQPNLQQNLTVSSEFQYIV